MICRAKRKTPEFGRIGPFDSAENGVIALSGQDFSAGGETPIPAALPLFATGLGTIGLLGWRKKRKAQAGA